MIQLRGLGKRYPAGPGRGEAVVALRDVTLEIERGGVTAVVGPNGAGKSTLFGLILGFLNPSDGSVAVEGRAPRAYVRARGAGYLPDRFGLPGGWTVRGGLLALAGLEGLHAVAARARVDELLHRFELEDHAARAVRTLSRGQLQRLGLAQALLGRRELLVLDEPAQGLDPMWRIGLRRVIGELAAEGRTVVLASHDLAEVERAARRAILLDAGRVADVLDLAAPAEIHEYRIVVARGAEHVPRAFPGARVLEGGTSGGGAPAGDVVPSQGTFRVAVADAAELSERLAALLAAGAVVSRVEPWAEPLEERVRRTLGTGSRATPDADTGPEARSTRDAGTTPETRNVPETGGDPASKRAPDGGTA